MSSLDGGRFYGSSPLEGSVLEFILLPLSRSSASFELGMDVTLSAGAASGEHEFDYLVTVQPL